MVVDLDFDYPTRREVLAYSKPGRPAPLFDYANGIDPPRGRSVLARSASLSRARSISRARSVAPTPAVAHQRLSSVPPPPRSVGNDNYLEFQQEIHRPISRANTVIVRYRRPAPSKVVYVKDVTDGYSDIDYEVAQAKREASQAKTLWSLGVIGPYYGTRGIPVRNALEWKETADVRRRYVYDRNFSPVQSDIYRLAAYQKPLRKSYIGRGNLSSISYAGGRPISRRRLFYPRYPEDDLFRNDFRSFYNSIRIAANLGRTYEKPLALYQPLYKSKKSMLGAEETPRYKRESKWVSQSFANQPISEDYEEREYEYPRQAKSSSPPPPRRAATPPKPKSPSPPPREPTPPPPKEPTPPPLEPTPPPPKEKSPSPPPAPKVKKTKEAKVKREAPEEVQENVTLPSPRKSVVELPEEAAQLAAEVPDENVVVTIPKKSVVQEEAPPAAEIEELAPAEPEEQTPVPTPEPVQEEKPSEPEPPVQEEEPVVPTPEPEPPVQEEEPVAATPTPEPSAAEEEPPEPVEEEKPVEEPVQEEVVAEETPASPVQSEPVASPEPKAEEEVITNGVAAEEEDEEAAEIAKGGKVQPGEPVSDFFGGGDEEEDEEVEEEVATSPVPDSPPADELENDDNQDEAPVVQSPKKIEPEGGSDPEEDGEEQETE